MARGKQKLDAQQKNAEKMAKMKKGTSNIASRAAGFKVNCHVCSVGCPLHYALLVAFTHLSNLDSHDQC